MIALGVKNSPLFFCNPFRRVSYTSLKAWRSFPSLKSISSNSLITCLKRTPFFIKLDDSFINSFTRRAGLDVFVNRYTSSFFSFLITSPDNTLKSLLFIKSISSSPVIWSFTEVEVAQSLHLYPSGITGV